MEGQYMAISLRIKLVATIVTILAAIVSFRPAVAQQAASAAAAEPTDAQIAALIEQLGNDDFAVRQRAQTQLSRMGLEAFDALVAAQYHRETEVQMRSKFLVRGMTVRWFDEADPPEVARLLKSYGAQDEKERRSRMDRLGNMLDLASVNALCRLARYEISPILSKHAALLIMHRDEPKTAAAREEMSALVAKALGASKRPAAGWLQLYRRTLLDRASANDEWQAVLKKEREFVALHPELTDRQIVRDLYRWQIKSLQQLQRDADVIALMRQSIELLDSDPQQVTEFVDWLVVRKAWQVVIEVGKKFPHLVSEDPVLMYLQAHAYESMKQPEPALELTDAALQLRSDNLEEHLVTALKLEQNWGLFDYSEREYREVMKKATAGSYVDFKARFQLSEQLHDRGLELKAAECLKPAVDLMFPEGDEAKGEMAREVAKRFRVPEAARSRMHYFFSRHYHEQKDFAKEKKSLGDALASDPTDADVLIARFRLTNLNEAERAEINQQIDETASKFRDDLNDWREAAEEATDEQERASCNFQLAIYCNQFAWLVSNTRGDFDESLKWSQRSVEIRTEEGGYWDTLGRCYYAKGDLENAVKTQAHALKLSPHAGQIRRQLEFFEKELAAKKARKP
jgi:tetratricopeptide (TPR) repeat protein